MHYLLLIALTLLLVLAVSNWAKKAEPEQVKKALVIFLSILLGTFGVTLLISGRLLWLILIALIGVIALYPLAIVPKNKQSEVDTHEAMDILGLAEGDLTPENIEIAYKKMIKKNHPDTGGSLYMARKIIEAKRILLESLEK